MTGRERIKGDERILGDSDFVIQVLKEAEEEFERYYEMKRSGYDLKTVEDRVCRIFNLERKALYSGREKRQKRRPVGYSVTGRSRNWDTG